MKRYRKPYTFFQKASAVFLVLTLLWLTVSTPFIISGQQPTIKQGKIYVDLPVSDGNDDSGDTSGNNVDEKAPNSNLSEEFLHEQETSHCWYSIIPLRYSTENTDTYIAFHGELHAPPPNAA